MDFERIKIWLIETDKEIRNRWLLAILGTLLTPIGVIVAHLWSSLCCNASPVIRRILK